MAFDQSGVKLQVNTILNQVFPIIIILIDVNVPYLLYRLS